MTDMGPDSLKNVIVEASMSSMKLMEIANFLNARECHFVQERSRLEKRMTSMEKNCKNMDAELKKARPSYQELGAKYDAYKDKYQLQVELTQTLATKKEEAERLAKEKESLMARVTELEGQL
jgi:multidrug resistance efflux pump